MAFFGPPAGLSSWSGASPPAQYYPPQPPSPQYTSSSSFEMHPIFWVFICFVAFKLCYSDFYRVVQCLPNPYPVQYVAAPAANTQANQNQQKNESKKDGSQNQQGKKDGKDQKQKEDEKSKDEKSKDSKQKDDKSKDNEQKDEKSKDNKQKDDKSNTVIVRPSCKYFAGQRIWV
ncbi:uncharacterized protein FA14DRAFT_174930 [Meira miltonrushii]|uniref:Uncharacterized protein n=1 Tax=Meira miltonrushii TaxID=1280837 RepID=A0A316V3Q3_9BASI|nr:uncharacterized protein FA14DRAFT_174930 [Meira miltonrushii]PWN32082.1 hypothetical protein FA14DRAFT_174930 [Meira miltonrushii]